MVCHISVLAAGLRFKTEIMLAEQGIHSLVLKMPQVGSMPAKAGAGQ